jgi:DNA-binding protein
VKGGGQVVVKSGGQALRRAVDKKEKKTPRMMSIH